MKFKKTAVAFALIGSLALSACSPQELGDMLFPVPEETPIPTFIEGEKVTLENGESYTRVKANPEHPASNLSEELYALEIGTSGTPVRDFTKEQVQSAHRWTVDWMVQQVLDSPVLEGTTEETANYLRQLAAEGKISEKLLTEDVLSGEIPLLIGTGGLFWTPKLIHDGGPRVSEVNYEMKGYQKIDPSDWSEGQNALRLYIDYEAVYRVADQAGLEFFAARNGMDVETFKTQEHLVLPALLDGKGENAYRAGGQFQIVVMPQGDSWKLVGWSYDVEMSAPEMVTPEGNKGLNEF